jgi:hypothetical protein
VLQDQHLVGAGQGQGAARAAFAGDGGDHGGAERQAAFGGTGDGLALPAFLGAHAGIGAGGVDEGQDRQVELLGHVHQAHRLTVAFGPGHPEVVLQAGLGVAALFVAHHHHRHAAEAAKPADHRLVVAEGAVAAQLDEVLDQPSQEVGKVRPVRVAGHLGLLPWVQPRIDVAAESVCAAAQSVDFGLERASFGGFRELGQFVELGLDLGDGPFEIQVMTRWRRHALSVSEVLGKRADLMRKPGAGPECARSPVCFVA